MALMNRDVNINRRKNKGEAAVKIRLARVVNTF
jgi:hypothetical protein